jgi:hypothetical protein
MKQQEARIVMVKNTSCLTRSVLKTTSQTLGMSSSIGATTFGIDDLVVLVLYLYSRSLRMGFCVDSADPLLL